MKKKCVVNAIRQHEKKGISTLIACILLALSLMPGLSAVADTLTVPSQYATIKEAMAAARAGDTVQVKAGTYTEEDVVVKDDVNLVGEGAKVTFLNGTTSLAVGNSVIEGFTFSGRTIVCASGSPIIRRNVIRNSYYYGIQISYAIPVIYQNILYNNYGGGILSNKNALIVNNTIINNFGSSGTGINGPGNEFITQNNLVVGNMIGLSDCLHCGLTYNGGYNNIWNNFTDWHYLGMNPGDISEDPLVAKMPRLVSHAFREQTELGYDTVTTDHDWSNKLSVGDHVEMDFDKVDRVVTEVAFVVNEYDQSVFTRIRFTPALTGLREVFPLLVWGNTSDFTYDFALRPGSPAIDAGNPDTVWNDFDGSRNDIGATGGNDLPAVWARTPPAPVDSLLATSGDAEITLSWTPPSDLDLKGFMVLRREGGPPTGSPLTGMSYLGYLDPGSSIRSVGNGRVVFFGTDPKVTSFTDLDRPPGIEYHYAVFAFDAFYNYSTARMISGVSFHEPRTFTVCAAGGCDYTRIGDAVNAVKPGDTVLVRNGEYTESILLRNGVRLRGESRHGVVIKPPSVDSSIIGAPDVTIGSVENLTLLCDMATCVGAVDFGQGVTVDLVDLTMKGFGTAVRYRGDSLSDFPSLRTVTIQGCAFEDNGNGLVLWGQTRAVVRANTFSRNMTAIELETSSPEIVGNTILGSTYRGISATNQSSPIIHDNQISGGYVGIGLAQYSNARIHRNVITDNSKSGIIAVYISTPFIHNNIIARNGGEGVWIFMSWARVHNNTIVGNGGNGIEVDYSGSIEAINNIVAFNEGWGSAANELHYGGIPSLSYNNVFGNVLGDTSPGTNVLVGNIYADPLFRNLAGGDYELAPFSPCINSGSPNMAYNDPDGTRNDMGAFGGPDAFPKKPFPPPTIAGILPTSGPMEGGTEVTITGSGFHPGVTVTFGPIPAVVTSESGTTIVATTGASHVSGVVSMVVMNPDGGIATFSGSYTYEEPSCTVSQEVCDGVDNDCDGLVDDADPGVTGRSTWYADSDKDGFGNPSVSKLACTQPTGYVSDKTDCNDANAAINPGAAEICDGVDNNCNGQIDDADAGVTGRPTWYADSDKDGFGNPLVSKLACTQPTGYVSDKTDCNDANAAIKPGATEVCDGVDNNCDGLVDDADPGVTGRPTWHADSDKDGFGNPSVSKLACTQPTGYVSDKTDCNDANAAIKPGATEICDGVDNNCDGQIDEGVTKLFYPDKDGDGFGDPFFPTSACQAPTGYVSDKTDCNDANAAIKPGAVELCSDGIDNDCNGLVDKNDPACGASSRHYYFFPSIKDNDAIGWENHLTVQAKDPVAMDVTIRVYGMSGALLGTFVYSNTDPAAKAPAIAPYARVAQRPSMIVGTTANPVAVEGSMIVETSVPAIATTNTIANSFEGFSIYEAAKPRSIHNFPKAFDGPNNYQVYMLVQNIHPTPVTVTAALYGKNATSPGHGASRTYPIPAYGTLKFRPTEIAGGIDFNGSVVVSSDLSTPGDGKGPAIPAMCRYELGTEAMTIYESTVTQPALSFPTMKDGRFGGSMEYQNYLSVVNPNASPVTVEAILYASTGAKQGTTGPVTLPADGKVTWRPSMIRGTVTSPIDFEGSVVVTSTAPVIGQTNTMYPGANLYQCDAFDLLESALAAPSLFFPKAFDNIVGTGHLYDNFVYVQNPDGAAKTIRIQQFNNNGTPNGERTLPLAGFGTHVFRPKDLVTDGTGQFRGSVRVTETGGAAITGAIKYDIHQGTTTSTPVDAMTLYRSMGQ